MKITIKGTVGAFRLTKVRNECGKCCQLHEPCDRVEAFLLKEATREGVSRTTRCGT